MAGWALTAAESASRAGARAAMVGRPAAGAALAALPASMRAGATASESGGRVDRHPPRAQRRARLRAADLLVDTRGPAVNARGQAAIELVFAACLAGLLAVGTLPLFEVWQARTRAERIADQAAVLVAEGRPLPGRVTRGADVDVRGHAVRVSVPGDARSAMPLEMTATARTP